MALDQLLLERLGEKGVQANDTEYFAALCSRCSAGERMTLHFSHGRESWHGLIPEVSPPEVQRTGIPRQISSMASRTVIRRASDEKSAPQTPGARFAVSTGSAVGTLVHNLFEKLDLITPQWDAETFCRENLPENPLAESAGEIFCNALAEPSEIRKMLENVPAECEVWKERRFLLRDRNGSLVPGAFDRVVIHRENGMITRAEIFDWKSDNLSGADDFLIYAGQLKLYRESLAQLLGLPQSAVSCNIVALKLKKIIPV